MSRYILNLFIIICLFVFSSCTENNEKSDLIVLKEFLAPGISQTNFYKCDYPCESIQMEGIGEEPDGSLKVRQTIFFSKDILLKNPNMASKNQQSYHLFVSDNTIIKSDSLGKNIILKSPFVKNTRWDAKGVSGVVDGQNQPVSVKAECRIVNSKTAMIFGKKRRVVTTKCKSNFSLTEISTTSYASGIGVLEWRSEIIDKDGIPIGKLQIKITNIKKNGSSPN